MLVVSARMSVVQEEGKRAFDRDGFLVVPSLLDQEELQLLRKGLADDESVVKHAFELKDGEGLKSKMSLWNHPGRG